MITKEQRIKMFEMRLDGKSYAKIAEEFNAPRLAVIRAISGKTQFTPQYIRNAVYPNLASWMLENGITPRKLSDSLDMSPDVVRAWLLGEREPRLSSIKALLAVTGMSFEEAFARREDAQEVAE